MRLTQTQEWTVVAALIVYIAFGPCLSRGFPGVDGFLASSIGKAFQLGVIAYVWKYVSALAAVLLVINFFRCGGGIREGADETLTPPSETSTAASAGTCPPTYTPKAGQPGYCTKMEGTKEMIVPALTGTTTPPADTVTPVTVPKNAPVAPPEMFVVNEGFLPNTNEPKKGGCAFSPL